MPHIMALQITSPVKDARIFELQTSGYRIGAHDGRIEIYQVSVVGRSSLRRADAVRVVTDRARGLLFEMALVFGKALVVKNAVSTVALVAEFVRVAALLREVRRFVAMG